MAKTYTVILSDAEDKALHVVATSAQEWIDNAVHGRCRIAMEEIISDEVQRKLAIGEAISGTKEDIVLAAPVESAIERNARLAAELAARQAELAAQQGAQA